LYKINHLFGGIGKIARTRIHFPSTHYQQQQPRKMTSETTPHPRVGVAAIIRNASGQLIVGKRLSSHGKGTWQFPGGHLEYGEEFFTCAERETLEETGLRVKAVRLAAVTNSVFVEDHKHYITLFVLCEMLDAEATPQVSNTQSLRKEERRAPE
jgi:ADP-ribose pyrophosphatase YjhB (NUDIX family)